MYKTVANYNVIFNVTLIVYNVLAFNNNNGSLEFVGNITFNAPWNHLGKIIVSPQLTKIYVRHRN